MDYSASNDAVEEPDEVNESFDSVEPEFTENIHETESDGNIYPEAVDSTQSDLPQDGTPPNDANPDDTNVTFHAQTKGIEVPSSPETEPLRRPSIPDWSMYGGGPEGGY